MKVEWTREPSPTPPAVFTLTLSEEEAETLRKYCASPDARRFRQSNRFIYDLEDALIKALAASF